VGFGWDEVRIFWKGWKNEETRKKMLCDIKIWYFNDMVFSTNCNIDFFLNLARRFNSPRKYYSPPLYHLKYNTDPWLRHYVSQLIHTNTFCKPQPSVPRITSFVYGIFNSAVGSSGYLTSNGGTISEWWIGKNVKGRACALMWRTMLGICWSKWGASRETWAGIVSVSAVHFSNTCQRRRHRLSQLAR
jgi:hypothetical protein